MSKVIKMLGFPLSGSWLTHLQSSIVEIILKHKYKMVQVKEYFIASKKMSALNKTRLLSSKF